jgi:phosphoglucomutase
MSNYLEEYKKWTNDSVFDEETKKELLAITDEKEIQDRFYKSLSFGTGGMRGVIGAGINRMNVYTVGKATQGLANFINKTVDNGSVVIAYDSRRMSPEFALRTALVMAGNGVKAYLFRVVAQAYIHHVVVILIGGILAIVQITHGCQHIGICWQGADGWEVVGVGPRADGGIYFVQIIP